jgi:hypothetical protein
VPSATQPAGASSTHLPPVSSECVTFIKDWLEKKVTRRMGFGGFKGEAQQGFKVQSLEVGLLRRVSQRRPRIANETRECRGRLFGLSAMASSSS